MRLTPQKTKADGFADRPGTNADREIATETDCADSCDISGTRE